MTSIDRITIPRPDDWHVHLRDGEMLDRVASYTARQFGRAIVMPNLVPPVTTVEAAAAYRGRIVAAAGDGFTPLMTAYLTDDIKADEIERGHAERVWIAAKLYPAGATTNSSSGVTDVANIRAVLARMERIGMPLCVHGEVTDPAVDVFDREAVFIDRVLTGIVRDFPALKIIFEHVTTRQAVEFVEAASANVAATITPQHMLLNRNALFQGGLRPHAYCLPVVKREEHRIAVRRAATSGSPKFFLGTDSAPHSVEAKQSSCGCAGIFNAPFALETYLSMFDEDGAIGHFEAFASRNGAAFYGLQLNAGTITLERREQAIPDLVEGLVPFLAGSTVGWRIAD
ncbi:MAG TPA: dihydroorotase [Sphingomicrobium sp.]|nr:dihydroorotase [Sphingomicrobium sp.]